MNKGKKTLGKFIVTSSNPAVTFEFLKETFNEMTFLVLLLVERNNDFAIAARLNTSGSSLSVNLFSELVRIISGISHNYIGF